MDQLTDDSKTADIAMSSPLNGERDPSVKRAIEVGFPIVEINRLAVPERNSFKPIYQMHKWFARRASCVFRAILLGTLKPAIQSDGTPTDLMEEFYKDHSNDPDTNDKVILDPFMGGGTTVVEALRLGCRVIGVDLNPVAWFIVKAETDPVDLDKLKAAFERLAARPVSWNDGRPLKDTLLHLYKTEVAEGIAADVIYTFWVKSAICTDPNCKREVPLFTDYILAQKSPRIRYHRDAICPTCRKTFDWEIELASLIAEPALMINSPRGSGGEGRPATPWSYAAEPPKPRGRGSMWQTDVSCPHCRQIVRMRVPSARKSKKSVALTVLFCPSCEAVWQWRGPLPEGEVICPSCRHNYDPRKGNVPEKGKFQCSCGQKDDIIASIRTLPQDQRLPVRPYAVQAYLPLKLDEKKDDRQPSFFDDGDRDKLNHQHESDEAEQSDVLKTTGLLLPKNGKFFKRFTVSDLRRLQQAETLWQQWKCDLPYPKSTIPTGDKTKSGLLAHHFNHWHEMFASRQLLALSTLLQGIMAEEDRAVREMLLCTFSESVGRNNLFCRYYNDRNTIQEIFSRHDFQPKTTIAEGSLFGDASIRGTYPQLCRRLIEAKTFNGKAFDWKKDEQDSPTEIYLDSIVTGEKANLKCGNSTVTLEEQSVPIAHTITDPPYVGNVNYAELSDFYYVWLRLLLKDCYPHFSPEYTPKLEEIVKNATRGKGDKEFFDGLASVFTCVNGVSHDNSLLIFTFHHKDPTGHIWEGLLESLCRTGFEILAVYPVHGEKDASLHLLNKENISYDLIHVCRKRRDDSQSRSWAGVRQEMRRKAREELQAIERGRYGNQLLPEPDVRLICIGKCLELYSAHYGKVLDHDNNPLPLHKALQDISAIVDQLVTKERPLPSELEAVDGLSYVWFRVLAPIRNEVMMDAISKSARGMRVSVDDLKDAGLVVRGRTGRGRTYEVKQPAQRLGELLAQYQPGLRLRVTQGELFTSEGQTIFYDIPLVDLVHLVIALAQAGESVVPWLERFAGSRSQLGAALRYLRDIRADWKESIDRVLALIEGAPLIRQIEEA